MVVVVVVECFVPINRKLFNILLRNITDCAKLKILTERGMPDHVRPCSIRLLRLSVPVKLVARHALIVFLVLASMFVCLFVNG